MGDNPTNDSKHFYDIHLHAFNSSHPGLFTFINRFFLHNAITIKDLIKGKILKIIFKMIGSLFTKGRGCWRALGVTLAGIIIIIASIGTIGTCLSKAVEFCTLIIKIADWWDCIKIIALVGLWLLLISILVALFAYALWRAASKLKRKGGLIRKIKGLTNILSIVDNDLGRQFRYIELDYLSLNDKIKEYLRSKPAGTEPIKIHNEIKKILGSNKVGFKIEGETYDKVILTPLMMDFEAKGLGEIDKEDVHYSLPPRKTIFDQSVDLFNGVMEYYSKPNFGLLEIYPFMALNTKHYSLGPYRKIHGTLVIPDDLKSKFCFVPAENTVFAAANVVQTDVETLLNHTANSGLPANDKQALLKLPDEIKKWEDQAKTSELPDPLSKILFRFFGEYKSDYDKLRESNRKIFGLVKGVPPCRTVREVKSGFFAGIKVYPPLDFDPWPGSPAEQISKIHLFYHFCEDRRIPITTHCGDGGFSSIDREIELIYTDPKRWRLVLENYPRLKLNFAHFGHQAKKYKEGFNDKDWFGKVLYYIKKYDHVYADISYLGTDDKNYKFLTDNLSKIREGRILFGTDFMVNLFDIDSYYHYLKKFSDFEHPQANFKTPMVTTNPRAFLFDLP